MLLLEMHRQLLSPSFEYGMISICPYVPSLRGGSSGCLAFWALCLLMGSGGTSRAIGFAYSRWGLVGWWEDRCASVRIENRDAVQGVISIVGKVIVWTLLTRG